jgi:predicted nucleic acid-binding protein
MRTAVDSSVLLLILRCQAGYERWRSTLSRAAEEGTLVICPVVFAECSVGFSSAGEASAKFDALGILYDAFSPESSWMAGQTFLKYRKQQGPREHLLPDFLIAAHASVQADRLAALDRGYLRRYFPDLQRLQA